MSQAYAECGYLRRDKVMEGLDSLSVVGRVAGAVGKHYSIRAQRLYLVRCGIPWHDCYVAAALDELPADIELVAVVHQHHVVFCVLSGVIFLCLDTDFRNHLSDIIRAYLRKERFPVEIAVDYRAVHYAALADYLREVTGVDVVNADDVVLLQVAVKVALAAEVRRILAVLSYDVAADNAPVGLGVGGIHAVVAYQRECLGHDLPAVAGVGESFLIAHHSGGEHYLSDYRTVGAERPALELCAVRKNERRFLFVLKNHLFSSMHLHVYILYLNVTRDIYSNSEFGMRNSELLYRCRGVFRLYRYLNPSRSDTEIPNSELRIPNLKSVFQPNSQITY